MSSPLVWSHHVLLPVGQVERLGRRRGRQISGPCRGGQLRAGGLEILEAGRGWAAGRAKPARKGQNEGGSSKIVNFLKFISNSLPDFAGHAAK